MPTRNVVLTEYQAEFIGQLVSSGRYQNASEVLREGIRLIERQEAEKEVRLKALREAADAGIADIRTGCFRSFDAPELLHLHLAALADSAVAAQATGTDGE